MQNHIPRSLCISAGVIRHCFTVALLCLAAAATFGNQEHTGQFEKTLVANTENFERVILKGSSAEKWSILGDLADDTHFASAKIADPQTGKFSVLVLLVEEEDEDPVLYADVNGNNLLEPDEKFVMTETKPDNPYLWQTTVRINVSEGFFTASEIFVRYFKTIQTEKMTRNDRLITQSTEVFAWGSVDVNGKKVLVQYALAGKNKVDHRKGWQGMDADGDGEVDMDNLSPEAAEADNEAVIFRVGDTYLSTKRADVSKNTIVLREHQPKEYKRLELYTGKDFPEFNFVDFDNKKRTFSEFRGKYVLLDIWGFWCPPCRKELPYLREAHKRFSSRNLIIVGLNTDTDYTTGSMKKALNENGMNWTHGKFESVVDFLRSGLRISSFPTTFLISPEGKILSMSRHERDEPDLRGKDLLESLDEILPD